MIESRKSSLKISYLHGCKENYSKLLAKELVLNNILVEESGKDWAFSKISAETQAGLNSCWATQTLIAPIEVSAQSVNAQSQKLIDLFAAQIKDQDIKDIFFIDVFATEEKEGLHKRAKAVLKLFQEKLSKRFFRISKLVRKPVVISPSLTEGLFIYWTDFNRMYVSSKILWGGQHRVADDPKSPSRSFLKVEEAYGIFGRRPKPGELVIDLGASPGGWTYSAIKNGVRVWAVDRGPMKGVCCNHPLIQHIEEDAFKFNMAAGKSSDWLFCDLVENPYRVLEILKTWIIQNRCRNFIVNLKIGQIDQLMFVERMHKEFNALSQLCSHFLSRQLYHDRDEITIMGNVKSTKNN